MSKQSISPAELLAEQLTTAEVGVLGSMLIDEAAVGPMLLAVNERDFQTQAYRNIFRAIRDLYNRGSPVDSILVNETLGGGYGQAILDICDRTPTAANADAYAEALKSSSRLWQLRQIGAALDQADDEDQCRELIDRANLLFSERSGIRCVNMDQAFREFFTRKDGSKADHLRWGFADLDEQLHVGHGDMVVIGGYPSAGKTAFALQLAFHVAKVKRVGFFSYETDADKLYDRTVACQTLTDFGKIMKNELGQEDYGRVEDMRQHLTAPKLELLEANGMTVSAISSYAMAHHYDVIFIDYLQKIPVNRTSRYGSDFERVSQVSNDLQQMGRSTGITVVALSQLSRPEKTKSGEVKPPRLSDLRQSGQIEQDADVVLLLYKEYPDWAYSQRLLDIAKNKDGVSGLGLRLNFDGAKQRFSKALGQPSEQRPGQREQPTQQIFFHPIGTQEPSPFDTTAPPEEGGGKLNNKGAS